MTNSPVKLYGWKLHRVLASVIYVFKDDATTVTMHCPTVCQKLDKAHLSSLRQHRQVRSAMPRDIHIWGYLQHSVSNGREGQ